MFLNKIHALYHRILLIPIILNNFITNISVDSFVEKNYDFVFMYINLFERQGLYFKQSLERQGTYFKLSQYATAFLALNVTLLNKLFYVILYVLRWEILAKD